MELKLEKVQEWLRKEAEEIDGKIFKIEIKRKKLIENTDISSLNKINQFNIEIRELQAIQNKLYELIGRSERELI